MKTHKYDTVIVGAGGAGMRAAIESTKRSRTAVLTKLYPTRSHTGAPFDLDGFTPRPTDGQDGTRLPSPGGTVLHVHRVLEPVAEHPPLPRQGALGHVATGWQGPDGTRRRAVLMTLLDA